MSGERDLHEDQVEHRLREWLREGPDRLPGRGLGPILAHAEAHPRRAGRLGLALRRQRVAVRDALAGHRQPVAVLAGLAVVVAGAGLGSWLMRPAAVGPASPLDGWVPATAADTCTTFRYPVQVDATRWAAGRLACQYTATDPRQDGVRSVALSSLTVERNDGAGETESIDEIYGRATQRTASGLWQCVFSGEIAQGQRIAAACRGTGEDAALEMLMIGTGADGSRWTYRSWIEAATPGEVPNVPAIEPWGPGATPLPGELAVPDIAGGTEACSVIDPGLAERAGDAVHVRGETVRCEIESSDARIAGSLELERSSERLDDGGLTTWGTARLVATDGAIWAGPFVGAWEPQLDPGETITRTWLVREDGGSGEIILREQGPPTVRAVEAEIRP